MEKSSSSRLCVTVASVVVVAAISSIATMFITSSLYPERVCGRVEVESGKLSFPKEVPHWDDTERINIEEKGMTVVRMHTKNRCYLMPMATQEMTEAGRPLELINEPLSEEVVDSMAGPDAVQFCQHQQTFLLRDPMQVEQARKKRAAAYGSGESDHEGSAGASAEAGHGAAAGASAGVSAEAGHGAAVGASAGVSAEAGHGAAAPAAAPASAETGHAAAAPAAPASAGTGHAAAAAPAAAAAAGPVPPAAQSAAGSGNYAKPTAGKPGVGIFAHRPSGLDLPLEQREPRCVDLILDCGKGTGVGEVQTCYTWINGVIKMAQECVSATQFKIYMTKPPGRMLKIAQQQWKICLQRRKEGLRC